jgi:molybdate transport repressor ModE-like protein
MDIEALRLLLIVAETGSFSRTAERCFISQSAVSQRIQAMEQEFGQKLVERGKGRPGARFTEAGLLLAERSRDLVARADALRREMAEVGKTISGSLRVGTVYSIGLHALTPALTRYLTKYPQVNLHLEYLRTDKIYESLSSGAIDCGIVACPYEKPLIEVVPLGEEDMILIARPGHPLAAWEHVPVSKLQGIPFIAFEEDIPTRPLIDSFLQSEGVTVDIMQAFDNIETIKQAAQIGLGVAIVPESTVRREIADNLLIGRYFAEGALRRPTGILVHRGRPRRRTLDRFITALMGEEETGSDILIDPK